MPKYLPIITGVQEWHIITCEYPPQLGGVSDYTWMVARGLAEKGDRVHVWCPSGSAPTAPLSGVTIHRELGKMNGAALRLVGKRLNEFPSPRRILVQWVPHGYGYRSMNLRFCMWLWKRARVSNDEVDLMVHEPFLAFGEGSWKQDAAAAVHRIMAMMILNAAKRVWVSIPAWRDRLRPYLLGRNLEMEWLPIPSSVECDLNPIRNANSSPTPLGTQHTLGHFGTFGRPIVEMLEPLIVPLLEDHIERSLVLIGRGSTEFRSKIIEQNPQLDDRVHATGQITAAELSAWVQKCDMMIQPYPDGVSGRRTTAMVGLSHGRPVVTTSGTLTEEVWEQNGLAALVPPGDILRFLAAVNDLLSDEQKRSEMGFRARRFYADHFDVRHTIHSLRFRRELDALQCQI